MLRRIRILLIVSCLGVAFQVNAQFVDSKTIEIGPHAGLSYYMGDINPTKPFAQSDLEFGGVARLNIHNRWSFRFDYSHATVKASDEVIGWRPDRGLNFTTKINDFSLMAEFNFWEYFTGVSKKGFSPYIFGGISIFQYTPYQRLYDPNQGIDVLVDLREYQVDTIIRQFRPKDPNDPNAPDRLTLMSGLAEFFGGRTKKIGVSIPFGVGVKFSLSKYLAATVEWRMQKTLTDYLDGVGGVYFENPDPITINGTDYNYNLSDPTGNFKPGQQRGNSAFDDWFGMARVSLTWKFEISEDLISRLLIKLAPFYYHEKM